MTSTWSDRCAHLSTAARSAAASAASALAALRPAPLGRRGLILALALGLASPLAAGGALAATGAPQARPQAAAWAPPPLLPAPAVTPDSRLRDRFAARQERRAARAAYVRHQDQVRHRRLLAAIAAAQASQAAAQSAPSPSATPPSATPQPTPVPVGGGVLSAAQVGALWLQAGGPAAAEVQAETVAWCESGDNPAAVNASSGAAGLMQILGQVVPGNIFDPLVNMENAVAKYNAAGGWSPWVCPP
jgi:hypothetical protein